MTATSTAPRPSDAWFVTTHWSVVLSAGKLDSPQSGQALETLCRAYWYPLYAYVRRTGRTPHDAQDLTQEFFARLLHKEYLGAAARDKGRFRTFLIVALKRFLANEWDRARAQKRGGQLHHLPLDTALAEQRYRIEAVQDVSADRIFDRRWALALLERATTSLRTEFDAAGKLDQFEKLKNFLTADRSEISYTAAGALLGISEPAARVAVHRLRKCYRELFRQEIAHTVSTPLEIEQEVRYLLFVLSE